MSSNVAIRLEPTTVKRRSLCGSSHDRCRCAARPGREAQEAEHDVLDARAHVGLAARLDLEGSSSARCSSDRDVVRAERPQRVLVGAQLAEVEPVRVDVVDVAELAGVGDLLELGDAGVVLEQVADHQDPAGLRGRGDRALGVRDRTAPAASRRSSACRRRSTRSASAAWVGTGVASTTASRSGSASRSSRSAVKRARRERARRRARARPRRRRSTRPARSPGSAAKLRARFGPQ